MSKFYQRYISGVKKTSEEEKSSLLKSSAKPQQVDPTAMASNYISKTNYE